MLRRAKVDLAIKGLPREKIDEQEKEMLEALKPEAEKQVKIYLVLAEVAKREKIALDDHMPRRVMEFLLKEANWNIA
jgi:FKBP-type peptidyl-prolyl cis-trans isomerase (trigger factor)